MTGVQTCALPIFRPEYYARQAGEEVKPRDRQRVEIIIGKQRNGPTGVVSAAFREFCTRFEHPSAEDLANWSDGSGESEPPKAYAPGKATRHK